jgi:glycosyltransferase involved in cell wall biosynthesis
MHKKPKVAFIAQPIDTVLPPFQTSIGIWTHEVARRLAESCNITIYARKSRLQRKPPSHPHLSFRFVPALHYRIFLKLFKPFSMITPPKRPPFSSNLFCLDYALFIAKDIRNRGHEIIHLQNFPQLIPVLRRFNPTAKLILHMHCEWLTQLDPSRVSYWLRGADLVLGCSDFITRGISDAYPNYSGITKTVYNGVDCHLFSGRKNRNRRIRGDVRLLFVGRNSPEKGLHILIEAFRRVVDLFPQAKLRIIGTEAIPPLDFIIALSSDHAVQSLKSFYRGGYVASLKRQSKALGLNRNIRFTGFVPSRIDLVKHFQTADLFVFPSVWPETFGIPVIEAMSAELPVIASRVGGIPEIIKHGETGLLTDPGHVNSLSNAMIRLIQEADLRKRMGHEGRKRVLERFTWEHVSDRLLSCYRAISEQAVARS